MQIFVFNKTDELLALHARPNLKLEFFDFTS